MPAPCPPPLTDRRRLLQLGGAALAATGGGLLLGGCSSVPVAPPLSRVAPFSAGASSDGLPAGWRLAATHPLRVPGLSAERHLLEIVRTQA